MSIIVNKQAEQFFLAFIENGQWLPKAGHRLTIDGHEFCVIPEVVLFGLIDAINVTKIESGARVGRYFVDEDLETEEHFLEYVQREIGTKMAGALQKYGFERFKVDIKEMAVNAAEKCGPRPDIYPVDVNVMAENIGKVQ